ARPRGDGTPDNPFGVEPDSTVDTVIFNGGYGVDYVEFAADILADLHGGEAAVEPQTEITATMQPRFVAGNPPDLIDNSGAQSMGRNANMHQIEALTYDIDAHLLDG